MEASIGITVFMAECSFEVELSRQSVADSLVELDADLTQFGLAQTDIQGRVATVMLRSLDMSVLLGRGESDQEEAVMVIACGFLYAYSKEQGVALLTSLRGLVGCLADDTLYLNPCADADSYALSVPAMRQQAEIMLGFDADDLIDCTPLAPTIH